MKKGERRLLKIRPEFAFKHKDCEYHLPNALKEEENRVLSFDLQLINWYPKEEVTTVIASESVTFLKRVFVNGIGYENPRPPYKVTVFSFSKILSSGKRCDERENTCEKWNYGRWQKRF